MVPGGPGQQELMEDEAALVVPAPAGGDGEICHFRLHRLAGAGRGRPAQGQARDLAIGRRSSILSRLAPCRSREHVVIDGNIVTGAGVASGIDFALTLAAILEGEEAAREIQLQIEYDPAPPFDSGSPKTAARRPGREAARAAAPLNEARKATAARVGKKLGV